jgi:hypothetical protein
MLHNGGQDGGSGTMARHAFYCSAHCPYFRHAACAKAH